MQAWKAAGFRVVGHVVFTKTYASKSAFVGYRHESAYILAKGRPPLPEKPLPDVMSWQYTDNRHHPTEKPVSVLRPLIESFTQPGSIVLDPFAGSGSTCVAAEQAGRRWIGIELMEQYHATGLPWSSSSAGVVYALAARGLKRVMAYQKGPNSRSPQTSKPRQEKLNG